MDDITPQDPDNTTDGITNATPTPSQDVLPKQYEQSLVKLLLGNTNL